MGMTLVHVVDITKYKYIEPFIINYDNVDEKRLTDAWKSEGNHYIVESLDHSQCLAHMYMSLSEKRRRAFHVIERTISEMAYRRGDWKKLLEPDKYPYIYMLDRVRKLPDPEPPMRWIDYNGRKMLLVLE